MRLAHIHAKDSFWTTKALRFLLDCFKLGHLCIRLHLLPPQQPVAIGIFINDAEVALLPPVLGPEAAFFQVNFPRHKRGWSTGRFRWMLRVIKRACGNRPVIGATWGYRDKVNHGHDVDQDFSPFYRFERGLVRGPSAPPNDIRTAFIVSKRSIYFDGRIASEWEAKLNTLTPGMLSQSNDGRRIIEYVLQNNSKYALKEQEHPIFSDDLLIIGQCTGDQAIEQTDALAKTNTELVQLVVEKMLPAGCYRRVYFKPHPLNKGTAQDIKYLRSNHPYIEIIDGGISIAPLFNAKPTVATLTSGAGLEAAIRGCHVQCFGIAFYSNWGFTTDYVPCDRRRNILSPEDVFLFMVLEHTAYVDWRTGKRISATDAFGLA